MEQTTIDFDAAERAANVALETTGCAGEAMPDVGRVLRRLGARVIEVAPHFLPFSRADFGFHDGRPIVRVRKGLSPQQSTFCVAHECGHFVDRLMGVRPRHHEAFANLFASALLVRREPLTSAWRRLGELRTVAAEWSHVPPTAVALRLGIGELGLTRLCVVQGDGVRYDRGMGAVGADALEIARRAARSGRATAKGLRACRLRDAPLRAAVHAA